MSSDPVQIIHKSYNKKGLVPPQVLTWIPNGLLPLQILFWYLDTNHILSITGSIIIVTFSDDFTNTVNMLDNQLYNVLTSCLPKRH
ncbi:MAG: hypothetical protein M3Z01_08910 [Thermoproteota archaeon]|nr:hypothetical protein [Thermoproteota archaeon]